ncbi:MAG: DNRLRE domain-containing protein [Parafilimonas sp.]
MTVKISGILMFLSLTFLFLSGCQKDVTQSKNATQSFNSLPLSSDNASAADLPGVYRTPSGNLKLVLQPGPDIGHDAWIEYSPTNSSYAIHNSNGADEIHTLAWTTGGDIVIQRILLKFEELSQIPATAPVQQATLYLYGLTSSDQLPQGDSYFPGSPYDSYGPNDSYIRRITSKWDEHNVTWNTMPSSTVNNESLIPPSTKQWGSNTSGDVTKIVKTFVTNPKTNNGFILSLTNENIYHSYGFYASETTTASKRPKLIIIYSPN